MLEIGFLIILGVFTGFLTGLTPGIHPNTVIFSFLPFYFSLEFKLIHFMSFLAALSVSHTFHDFIPSIFLGAPESETALAALPGAEKAANGEAIEAFYYTLFGGMYSIAALILVIPAVFINLETFYSAIKPFMGYILIFFLLVVVFNSEDLLAASAVAGLSGLLGILSFSMPVNSQYVLVPVFSGLFALPSVLGALSSSYSLPEQKEPRVLKKPAFRGGIVGSVAGIFTGIFPGLSPAVSTSFFSPLMERKEDFLAAMGGVNSSDIIMTFLSLYLIGKARSGAAVALQAVSSIKKWEIVFLAGVSFLSAGFSLVLAFKSPRIFLNFVRVASIEKILLGVLILLVASVFGLTGFPGLLALATSGAIGHYASLRDERRPVMAVLLVPSILFFSGFTGFI